MSYSRAMKVCASLFFAAVLSACTPSSKTTTIHELREAQAKSGYGPTTKWRLAPATWSQSTQDMRDRAYRFCAIKRPKDMACRDAQDASLIVANHAESNFANLSKDTDSISPYFEAIRMRPEAFINVRDHCLQIYEDAGSADARLLGPCISNAVGGDYFGIVPVP